MISVQEVQMEERIYTYWRGQTPISHLDHFAMTEAHLTLVQNTGIDIASHTFNMSAHKPIFITLKAQPATKHYPYIEPPLPAELSIERSPEGDYVCTEASTAMNAAVEKLITTNMEQWEAHPSPELAERFLLQIEQQAANAVAKQKNDKHHLFRNKTHGWSPTQVVL
jgi:hypothetical protein